jgi:thiamine-monophosphate kinase
MTLAGHTTMPVGRGGAEPGDVLFVTGALGDAAAGFLHKTAPGLAALYRPQPPVGFGAALSAAVPVHAMMDLSDGLARDLGRMCKASGLTAVVNPDALPMGAGLQGIPDPLPAMVSFGEDYQLIFATPKAQASTVARVAELHAVQVTQIGRFEAGDPVAHLQGMDWPAPAFTHFGEGE